MLSLVILFTGAAVTILVKDASCAPDLDLDNILKILQHQQQDLSQKQKLKIKEIVPNQSSAKDESEDDISHYGSLKKLEILKLMQLAQQNKDTSDENHSNEHIDLNIKHSTEKVNSNRLNHGLEYEHDPDDLIHQVLTQVSQAVESSNPKKRYKKSILDIPIKKQLPNTLIPSNIEISGGKNQDVADLNDYSKIYIVLNPQAVKKSKNKNILNDLVSKVLSLSSSSSPKQLHDRNKQQYYKGFPVNKNLLNLLARRRRDSSEVFVTKDSMEESYKPKRGGGGNSGRTAIPYIRHRGDIYEKEH